MSLSCRPDDVNTHTYASEERGSGKESDQSKVVLI